MNFCCMQIIIWTYAGWRTMLNYVILNEWMNEWMICFWRTISVENIFLKISLNFCRTELQIRKSILWILCVHLPYQLGKFEESRKGFSFCMLERWFVLNCFRTLGFVAKWRQLCNWRYLVFSIVYHCFVVTHYQATIPSLKMH